MPSISSTRLWLTAIPNFHLVGRLAEYKYYNMDAIVARSLSVCDSLLG